MTNLSRILAGALLALAFGGCSFVFGDAKYVSNDASLIRDTGIDDADAGDGGDADALPDGATGCVLVPELCTEGTRCASDGRCVPCDADSDGAQAEDATCDAAAAGAPRDCNDDDADVYPGAAPVCGDGKINGCDAGPMSFREALSVAEIGPLGSGELVTPPVADDLSSLGFDATAPEAETAGRLFVAFVSDDGESRVALVDDSTFDTLRMIDVGLDGEALGIDVRRVGTTEAMIAALARDVGGDALLSRGRYDTSRPPSEFMPVVYSFDDAPCVDAADASALVGDLSVDGMAGTSWLVDSGDLVHAPETGALSCTAIAGAQRSTGTDGPVVGLVEPDDGFRRTFRGAAGAIDDLDAVGPGEARVERPGYAFLRAAATDLYLSATVGLDGRTRVLPVACTTGVSCAGNATDAVTFDGAPGVASTYAAALDGLTGDFAAMVQIEERASAPAPDDRTHEVVLRILSHPNTAVGSGGGSAPGEALVVHRHAFDSTDRDHAEVREVDVATLRDPTSGDLTVYWAALVGDRRLAPGSPEDPAADNAARFGGVRFCVSE